MIIKRLPLLIAGGIGYVLGTRAGRERYDQIKRWASRVADNPAVQASAGFVRAQASDRNQLRRHVVLVAELAQQLVREGEPLRRDSGHDTCRPG